MATPKEPTKQQPQDSKIQRGHEHDQKTGRDSQQQAQEPGKRPMDDQKSKSPQQR